MKRFLLLSILAALIVTPAAAGCDKHAEAAVAAGHDCPTTMKGVERTVTNLDNGVRIEMAASDPAMVETLQKHMAAEAKEGCCADCPISNTAWNRQIENTGRGVAVTLTANSKDDVAKLQTAVAGMTKGGCSKGGCAKGAHKAAKA